MINQSEQSFKELGMKFTKILFAGIFAFSLATSAVAQDQEMTMDEYKAQLAEWQQREVDAKAAITNCEEETNKINDEIAALDGQINAAWDEIYNLVGGKDAVDAYRSELAAIEAEIDGLAALSPEELFKRRKEIDAVEEKLNGMKDSKVYALTEMQNKVASLEGKIARLRDSMPQAMYDEYTVVRGDYLWKIAKKDDIYGDPMQWVRIYSYNREQIKDPNLIYPEQIFKIQRGVGPSEYLVKKGDYLYKIAGMDDVLGDPTKWTQIYEQNKMVVGDDPNMIYPYQVLKLPE